MVTTNFQKLTPILKELVLGILSQMPSIGSRQKMVFLKSLDKATTIIGTTGGGAQDFYNLFASLYEKSIRTPVSGL